MSHVAEVSVVGRPVLADDDDPSRVRGHGHGRERVDLREPSCGLNDIQATLQMRHQQFMARACTLLERVGHAPPDMQTTEWNGTRLSLLDQTKALLHDAESISGAIVALTRTGELRAARELALMSREAFPEFPSILPFIALALENSLDFREAAATIALQLEFGERDPDIRARLESKESLLAMLADDAADLRYTAEELLALAECFVQAIRQYGRNIEWVARRGNMRCTVSLDFEVDGPGDGINELFYEAIGELIEKSEDRFGIELLPFGIHARQADSVTAKIESYRRGEQA